MSHRKSTVSIVRLFTEAIRHRIFWGCLSHKYRKFHPLEISLGIRAKKNPPIFSMISSVISI